MTLAGNAARICRTASSTRAWVRPLITTEAPAWASPSAVARPMPAVDPVTMAVRPLKSIFMCYLPGSAPAAMRRRRHASQFDARSLDRAIQSRIDLPLRVGPGGHGLQQPMLPGNQIGKFIERNLRSLGLGEGRRDVDIGQRQPITDDEAPIRQVRVQHGASRPDIGERQLDDA